MRLWFSPHSDVPLYRQLVTQMTLGILSGDLRPGDRLPSTRALARRFAIHPNTVSAAYRQLDEEGWVEMRRGSGVYVKSNGEAVSTPEQALEYHIAGFFRAMRDLGLPPAEVRARVARWLAAPPPDHFLLIDPDAELRRILLTELREVTAVPVKEATPEDCKRADVLAGAIAVCRPSKTAMVRGVLPSGAELLTLPITSATAWLGPRLADAPGRLVVVVSHWGEFLAIAHTMLVAAGIPAEALECRQAGAGPWRRGLEQASAILCDAYTASLGGLPREPKLLVFPLLADTAKDLLAEHGEVVTVAKLS